MTEAPHPLFFNGTRLPSKGAYAGGAATGALPSESWSGGAQTNPGGGMPSESWSGGAQTNPGGGMPSLAYSGGAVTGIADPGVHTGTKGQFGLQGGAKTAAGAATWKIASQGNAATVLALYAQIASLPASATTLFDLLATAGSGYYLRGFVDSTGNVQIEGNLGGLVIQTTLSTMARSLWYFITATVYLDLVGSAHVRCQMRDPNGDGVGVFDAGSPSSTATAGSYAATLALGLSVSSGYLNWPTGGANYLSKLELQSPVGAPQLLWMYDADATVGDALYMIEDGAGVVTTLADTSGGGIALSPGGGGATIVATTGPYR